jgi:hypothetical protein
LRKIRTGDFRQPFKPEMFPARHTAIYGYKLGYLCYLSIPWRRYPAN